MNQNVTNKGIKSSLNLAIFTYVFDDAGENDLRVAVTVATADVRLKNG